MEKSKRILSGVLCLSIIMGVIFIFSSCQLEKKSVEIPDYVVLQDTTVLQGKKIGCAMCYLGDEWVALLSDAIKTLGEYYGATITIEDGNLVEETQIKQVENMISNHDDLIFCDPVSSTGITNALLSVCENGIPLIIFDTFWENGEEKAVTTITWNQYESGVLIANYLKDLLKSEGKSSATLVTLSVAISSHCQERFDGFFDTINQASNISLNVLKSYDCQGNRELASNFILNIPEQYDFVLSDTENGAMGAAVALAQMGRKTRVLCMGAYGDEAFSALHDDDDNFKAIVICDPWVLAQNMLDAAIRYYNGEEQEKLIEIPINIVTHENAEVYWDFGD